MQRKDVTRCLTSFFGIFAYSYIDLYITDTVSARSSIARTTILYLFGTVLRWHAVGVDLFYTYVLYIKREVNNFLTLSRAAQNWIPHCTRKAQSPTPRCPGQRCMFLSIFKKDICFTLSKIFFMRDQYIGTWHPQASQISSHSSFMTFVYDNKNNEFVWWYPG